MFSAYQIIGRPLGSHKGHGSLLAILKDECNCIMITYNQTLYWTYDFDLACGRLHGKKTTFCSWLIRLRMSFSLVHGPPERSREHRPRSGLYICPLRHFEDQALSSAYAPHPQYPGSCAHQPPSMRSSIFAFGQKTSWRYSWRDHRLSFEVV